MHLVASRSLARFHGSRGSVNRSIAAASVPIAASESTLGLLHAIQGPALDDSGGVGSVLSASGGLAKVSFPGAVSVGSSVDFGKGLQGMVLQFDRKGAIVAPLSPILPRVGSEACMKGPLSVRGCLPETEPGRVAFKSVADILVSEDVATNSAHGILRLPSMPSPPTRRPVKQHLPSGLATVEALLPLGRGQRVGLVGPSGTGKTAAAKMLLASQPKDTICIYAAQRPLERLQKELKELCSAPLTVLYADPARDALLNRYLVPICALQMASQLRASHCQVVLILDDLVDFAAAAAELELVVGTGSRGPLPLSVPHVLGSALDVGGSVLMHDKNEHSLTVLPILDLDPNDELPSAIRNLWRGVEPSLDVCLRFSAELAMSRIFPAIDPKELLPSCFAPTFQAPLLKLLRAELRLALRNGYDLEERMQLSKQLGLESELDEVEDLGSSATTRALLSHSSARSLQELAVLLCAAIVYRLPSKRPSPGAVASFQRAVLDMIQSQHPVLWDSLQSLENSPDGDAQTTLRELGETLLQHRFDFELTRPDL